MSTDGFPLLYSELLPQIRQVSVAATLPSPSDATTRAEISPDGRLLTLSHGGKCHALRLPTDVSQTGLLPIAKLGERDLSWRLPLRFLATLPSQLSLDDSQSPWSAADLVPGSIVACRQCGQEIVRKSVIHTWKDLPSENWAEMMELWHCHKPDGLEPSSHEHLATRGYGANSAIGAQDGVGLIDLMLFALSEKDCCSLKVCSCPALLRLPVLCRVSRRWPGQPSAFSGRAIDTNTQE